MNGIYKAAWYAAMVAVGLSLSGAASGQFIIGQHAGANDPETEGWAWPPYNPTHSVVGPTNIGGTAAWDIINTAANEAANYRIQPIVLTPMQSVALISQGWHMSWGLN